MVVHLQGGNTDKQYYQEFAEEVARQGFVVIVPTHSVVFGPPGTPPSILPDQTLVLEGLATAKVLDADPDSPLYQITDTSKLGLTGHSVGGAVGLWSIEGRCQAPFCFGYFPKPPELIAGVFYGTNSIGPTGVVDDIATGSTPVALIQGGIDGRASPERGLQTYDILDGPRAYIELAGLNHYGINDVPLPEGATPDPNESEFPQHIANRRVANWTALALKAYMKDDALAKKVLYDIAPHLNWLVTAQTDPGE